MTQPDEKIIDRIRKLLALSKSSNQHEAELAMQRANELLTKYQLEMGDVLLKETEQSKVEEQREQVSETYRSFAFKLGEAAGVIFDCEIVRLSGRQAVFYYVGLREDIVCAQILFEHLFESWKSIVKVDYANWRLKQYEAPSQYDTKQYRIGHGQGFTFAVLKRARELAAARQSTVQATGTSLIVVKNQLIKEHMSQYKSMNNNFKFQGTGFTEGHQAGQQIPLSGALTGEDEKEQLT